MYRVLVAASGTPSQVTKQVEAVAGLPNVESKVEVCLVHVLEESAADEHDPMRVQAVSDAVEYLEERDISVEVIGRTGDAVSQILRLSEEKDVDAIYVGGPKRSPTGKAVFGSDTQQILLNANRPVTVILE